VPRNPYRLAIPIFSEARQHLIVEGEGPGDELASLPFHELCQRQLLSNSGGCCLRAANLHFVCGATKEVEETVRVAAAQAAPKEAQVSLSGSTAAAALSVPCLLLCAYVSACRRPPASEPACHTAGGPIFFY
jgi:hypothetical protein